MNAFAYADAADPVREDLAAAHRKTWEHVASPGTWLTGAQRVAVLEHGLEARRFVGAPPEPDQVRGAVTRGDLHEAKAVPGDRQSHRFGVDRRTVGKRQTGGEIAFVEVDVHGVRIPVASGSAV